MCELKKNYNNAGTIKTHQKKYKTILVGSRKVVGRNYRKGGKMEIYIIHCALRWVLHCCTHFYC